MRHYLDLVVERFNDLDSRTRMQLGIGISLLLLIIILLSFANDRITALAKKRVSREADLVQMLTLKQRYLSARTLSQRFSNRLATSRADDSPAKIIEEIGIKGKNSQIIPVKGEDRGEYVEDAAEVKLEGITANEAINLIYRLEKGTRPVIVKKANFKTRFDDPARLDLTITIALLKAAQPGRR
jgi:general secretion pathway protein M